jgi:hypothetical protein
VISIDQDDYSPALDLVSDIVGWHVDQICLEEVVARDEAGHRRDNHGAMLDQGPTTYRLRIISCWLCGGALLG